MIGVVDATSGDIEAILASACSQRMSAWLNFVPDDISPLSIQAWAIKFNLLYSRTRSCDKLGVGWVKQRAEESRGSQEEEQEEQQHYCSNSIDQ